MINGLSVTKQTMSSLEIAELTGKRHSDVLRDIRVTIAQLAELCAQDATDYQNNDLRYLIDQGVTGINNSIKSVDNFNRYLVDRSGRVYVTTMTSRTGRVINLEKPRMLKEVKDSYGYCVVSLNSETTKNKVHKVHRIVAEAYLDNPNNLPQVNHKNGNKTDNRVENLEWISPRDNVLHSYRELGQKPTAHWTGKENKALRKPVIQTTIEGVFIRLWGSRKEIVSSGLASKASINNSVKKKKPCKGFYFLDASTVKAYPADAWMESYALSIEG
jgi:hypothetical protein